MGANSGSVVSSIPASGFAASTTSGSNIFSKSRRGCSSSGSSNHFNEQKKDEIKKEREKLLKDEIKDIIIGIEPLGTEIGHKIAYYTRFIGRPALPTYLGGGTFLYHLSCLITLRKTRETIILEYGAYFGGEPNYKNYIHYVYDPEKQGGLRFSKMEKSDYELKINNGKEGSLIIKHLDIENKMSLTKLIQTCKKESSWTANDYNLASHNCQDFIAKIIEILKVKRNIYNDTLYSHFTGKALYPNVIVKALEKNDTPLALRIFQNIPIINLYVEAGVIFYHIAKKK